MKKYINTVFASLLALNTIPANAGEWQLGVAVENTRTGIMQTDADNEFAPLINYQGDKFSFIGGTLKYALVQSEGFQIELLGQGRPVVYDPEDSAQFNGMEERDGGFDAGLNLMTANVWGNLHLELLNDVSNTDKGNEIMASYRVPQQFGRWLLEPAIGLNWQSEDRVDYTYGVRPEEARNDRHSYAGEAAINPFAEFTVAYKLGHHWMIVGGVEYVRLDDSIADSPIIEKDYQVSTYSAMLYSF